MATIASLIVEIAGDNSRLRRSLNESKTLTDTYRRDIVQARSTFATQSRQMREDLFSGTLSPAQFAKQGVSAARAYNGAILETIRGLRAEGKLTPQLHEGLVADLRDSGLAAGKSFMTGLADGMKDVGSTLKKIGTRATLGITLPAIGAGVSTFKAASDAAEEANAFRVTFGPLADEVQKKLDNLHRTIPVTTTSLQNLASGFGALLLPMGIAPAKAAEMSTRLVRLAGDIQSLRNIPFNEVVQRLTSGLVGETEAVRRLGANIGEVALKAETMRLGFGNNITALTSAQKAQAVYNILLRDTALATGDAENTMDSAANTVRFATRNFQELQVTIGTRLLPILTPLIRQTADFFEQLKGARGETILFYAKLVAIAAIAAPVVTAIGSIISILGSLVGAIVAARTALGAAEGGSGLIAALRALPLALAGPAGWVVGIGLAVVALITWVDQMHGAKRAADELKSSVAAMTREQLAADIASRASNIGKLQQAASTAPLVVSDATRVSAAGTPTMTRSQIMAEITRQKDELSVLTSRWHDLTDAEAKETNMAARQLAVWKKMSEEFQAQSKALNQPTDKKSIAGLEQELGQIEQTQAALKKLGQSTKSLEPELLSVWTRATDKLLEHRLAIIDAIRQHKDLGKQFELNGLRLEEIAAKAQDALFSTLKLTAALREPLKANPRDAQGLPLSIFSPSLRARATAPGGTVVSGGVVLPEPRAARLPSPSEDVGTLRLRVLTQTISGMLSSFGSGLRSVVSSGFFAAIRSIAGQLNPFAQIISAITTAAAPLAPAMAEIAAVVSETLAPVFAAFAPVLRELVPVIRAVLQVLAPILKAVAPLFAALVPILKALFPVFKYAAIAATYIGQAFALAASMVLRASGNIIIVFGSIMKAFAQAVDALPFVSAKGAIEAAQGIIDFGKSLLTASDEFKQSAEEMAKAREEIRGISVDGTTASIDKLGEAAAETADALKNVPTWWKADFATWRAAHARGGAASGPVGVPGGPSDTTPWQGVGHGAGAWPGSSSGGGSGSGGGDGTDGASINSFSFGRIEIIAANRDGKQILREIIQEAQRISQATFGNTSRWAEVL